MPTQRQRQVSLIDTATIVTQTNQLDTTLLDIQINSISPRIQAVFQQLFNYGSGTFNDLTSGNLVGQLRGKKMYSCH
jgi:hypothetical protein